MVDPNLGGRVGAGRRRSGMHIRMPGIDGIEATQRIVADRLCEVLVLTTFDRDDLVDGAVAAGAAGFLLKSVAAP